MRMLHQPALQSSEGTIWMVLGAIFLIIALIPCAALTFAGTGRSAGFAATIGIVLVTLYVLILVARFTISRRQLRLRVMAVCMVTMAVVGVVGMWVCTILEQIPQSV